MNVSPEVSDLLARYFTGVSPLEARCRLLQLSKQVDALHPPAKISRADEDRYSPEELAQIDAQIQVLQDKGFTAVPDILRLMGDVHGVGRELAQKRIWVLSSRPPFKDRP